MITYNNTHNEKKIMAKNLTNVSEIPGHRQKSLKLQIVLIDNYKKIFTKTI